MINGEEADPAQHNRSKAWQSARAYLSIKIPLGGDWEDCTPCFFEVKQEQIPKMERLNGRAAHAGCAREA
jgi:hypothetical protein